MVKIMENPIKIDDLGVQLFLETPTWKNQPQKTNPIFLTHLIPDFFVSPKTSTISSHLPESYGESHVKLSFPSGKKSPSRILFQQKSLRKFQRLQRLSKFPPPQSCASHRRVAIEARPPDLYGRRQEKTSIIFQVSKI